MFFVVGFSVVVVWKGFEIFYDFFECGWIIGFMFDLLIWVLELVVLVGFVLFFF